MWAHTFMPPHTSKKMENQDARTWLHSQPHSTRAPPGNSNSIFSQFFDSGVREHRMEGWVGCGIRQEWGVQRLGAPGPKEKCHASVSHHSHCRCFSADHAPT